MQYLIYLIFLFVSSVGLSELIHSVWLFLSTKKRKNNKILLCYLSNERPDLELRYVSEQVRWNGSGYADKVVAIAYIDDESLLNRCSEIAKTNDILFINNEYFKSES